MHVLETVVFVMLWMLIAGCSGQKFLECLYKGIYDSSRIENKRGTTPAENAGIPDISYDQYNQERKEQIKNNPE